MCNLENYFLIYSSFFTTWFIYTSIYVHEWVSLWLGCIYEWLYVCLCVSVCGCAYLYREEGERNRSCFSYLIRIELDQKKRFYNYPYVKKKGRRTTSSFFHLYFYAFQLFHSDNAEALPTVEQINHKIYSL